MTTAAGREAASRDGFTLQPASTAKRRNKINSSHVNCSSRTKRPCAPPTRPHQRAGRGKVQRQHPSSPRSHVRRRRHRAASDHQADTPPIRQERLRADRVRGADSILPRTSQRGRTRSARVAQTVRVGLRLGETSSWRDGLPLRRHCEAVRSYEESNGSYASSLRLAECRPRSVGSGDTCRMRPDSRRTVPEVRRIIHWSRSPQESRRPRHRTDRRHDPS